MNELISLFTYPAYRVKIFSFLFLHEKEKLGKSILYTRKYNKFALEILKWIYFKNKRSNSLCEKILIEINAKEMGTSIFKSYNYINLFTKQRYKSEVQVSKIYYWTLWKHHFYKYKERYYAWIFQIRKIKKRVRNGDSNFRKKKQIKNI